MDILQHHKFAKTATPQRKLWRTLVVDDHPLFRDGLRDLIGSLPGFAICGEADNEEDAYQLFVAEDADLVTVDISLVAGSGLSLIDRIKDRKPSAAVLVISMFEDTVYAERALAAGASGYVCKHSDNGELKAALEAIQKGEVYVSRSVFQRMLNGKTGDSAANGNVPEKQLSGRELQIFTLIGQGRTTPQIANELHLAVSTVETYRERLKTKLNLASGAELTRHAILRTIQNS